MGDGVAVAVLETAAGWDGIAGVDRPVFKDQPAENGVAVGAGVGLGNRDAVGAVQHGAGGVWGGQVIHRLVPLSGRGWYRW